MTTGNGEYAGEHPAAPHRLQLIHEILVRKLKLQVGGQLARKTLQGYSVGTLERIHAFFSDDNMEITTSPTLGTRRVVARMISNEKNEEVINDLIDFLPAMNFYSERSVGKFISALEDYRKFGWLPAREGFAPDPRVGNFVYTANEIIELVYFDASEDRYENGPVPVTTRKLGTIEEYEVITDGHLVKFIWDHLESSAAMIEFVRERGSVDVGILEQVINDNNPPLSEGIL